jgi:hypothetical protein
MIYYVKLESYTNKLSMTDKKTFKFKKKIIRFEYYLNLCYLTPKISFLKMKG